MAISVSCDVVEQQPSHGCLAGEGWDKRLLHRRLGSGAQRGRAKEVRSMQSDGRRESEQLPRGRVRLPHQAAVIQKQNSAGKVRQYGGTERVGGLGFSALREMLRGEFMFLLLQLLNDGVIGVHRQSLRRQRSVIQ